MNNRIKEEEQLLEIANRLRSGASMVGAFTEMFEDNIKPAKGYADAIYGVYVYLNDISEALLLFVDNFDVRERAVQHEP